MSAPEDQKYNPRCGIIAIIGDNSELAIEIVGNNPTIVELLGLSEAIRQFVRKIQEDKQQLGVSRLSKTVEAIATHLGVSSTAGDNDESVD